MLTVAAKTSQVISLGALKVFDKIPHRKKKIKLKRSLCSLQHKQSRCQQRNYPNIESKVAKQTALIVRSLSNGCPFRNCHNSFHVKQPEAQTFASPVAVVEKKVDEKEIVMVQGLIAELEKNARPAKDRDDIKAVASSSIGNNDLTGSITDAVDKVGSDGTLSIESSSTSNVGGEMKIDTGYISLQYVTNVEKLIVEFEIARVFSLLLNVMVEMLALEAAKNGGNQWAYLLPPIYVNLGTALEDKGYGTNWITKLIMRCVFDPGDKVVYCPSTLTRYEIDTAVNETLIIPEKSGLSLTVELILMPEHIDASIKAEKWQCNKYVECLLCASKKLDREGAVTGLFDFLHLASQELQRALHIQRLSELIALKRLQALPYIKRQIWNPFSRIIFSRKMMKGTDLGEAQKQPLHISAKCQRQLNRILDDTNLDSIIDGYLDKEIVEFTLQKVLVVSISQVMIKSNGKGIRLVNDPAEDIMTEILCRESVRLQQVLTVLLLIAVHFTPTGGQLYIAASLNKDQLGESVHLALVEVRITHVGSGLPEALLNHMFGVIGDASQEAIGRYLFKLMNGDVQYLGEAGSFKLKHGQQTCDEDIT